MVFQVSEQNASHRDFVSIKYYHTPDFVSTAVIRDDGFRIPHLQASLAALSSSGAPHAFLKSRLSEVASSLALLDSSLDAVSYAQALPERPELRRLFSRITRRFCWEISNSTPARGTFEFDFRNN